MILGHERLKLQLSYNIDIDTQFISWKNFSTSKRYESKEKNAFRTN